MFGAWRDLIFSVFAEVNFQISRIFGIDFSQAEWENGARNDLALCRKIGTLPQWRHFAHCKKQSYFCQNELLKSDKMQSRQNASQCPAEASCQSIVDVVTTSIAVSFFSRGSHHFEYFGCSDQLDMGLPRGGVHIPSQMLN